MFERAFKDFGLPLAIRTDNGVPFSCANAFFGLSRLSVWWLRLGIDIERIKPGHPQQNGRRERTKFDDFIDGFNRTPSPSSRHALPRAKLYSPSSRPYRGLDELEYPFHDKTDPGG